MHTSLWQFQASAPSCELCLLRRAPPPLLWSQPTNPASAPQVLSHGGRFLHVPLGNDNTFLAGLLRGLHELAGTRAKSRGWRQRVPKIIPATVISSLSTFPSPFPYLPSCLHSHMQPLPPFSFSPSKANRHLPGQVCFMKTRKSNSQLPGGFASQGETLTPTLLSTELSHLWGSYRSFSPQSLKCWQLSQLQGTGEYAKAQRGDVTCPRSHSLELRELGLSYPRTSVLGPGAVLGKG